jgi:hypothetical protein
VQSYTAGDSRQAIGLAETLLETFWSWIEA